MKQYWKSCWNCFHSRVEASKAKRKTEADCIRNQRCMFKVWLFAASCAAPVLSPRYPPRSASPCVSSTHNSGSVQRFLYCVLAFHNKLGCLSPGQLNKCHKKSPSAESFFFFLLNQEATLKVNNLISPPLCFLMKMTFNK